MLKPLILVFLFLSSCSDSPRPDTSVIKLPSGNTIANPVSVDNSANTTEESKLKQELSTYKAQVAAAEERLQQIEQEKKAAELKAWRVWSRWVCGIAFPLCAAGIALGIWFGLAKIVVPIAIAVMAGAATLIVYAEAIAFAATIAQFAVIGIAVTAFVGLIIIVVFIIRKYRTALVDLAKLTDNIESGGAVSSIEVAASKARSYLSQVGANVHSLVQNAREKPVKDPSYAADAKSLIARAKTVKTHPLLPTTVRRRCNVPLEKKKPNRSDL